MPYAAESALSVAANATSTDRISGTVGIQFPDFDGQVTLAARASATGLNTTLTAGTDLVINDQSIPYTGAAGAIDFVAHRLDSFLVTAGSQLSLRFRNTTAAAITVDYVLRLDPV